ncbi:hypothetical protein BU15DRAFT_80338 [Melanogaster broomeanus]|nr:hypothetical protein BU15DRAFT_80338 [Melanogaster broomeanus]
MSHSPIPPSSTASLTPISPRPPKSFASFGSFAPLNFLSTSRRKQAAKAKKFWIVVPDGKPRKKKRAGRTTGQQKTSNEAGPSSTARKRNAGDEPTQLNAANERKPQSTPTASGQSEEGMARSEFTSARVPPF